MKPECKTFIKSMGNIPRNELLHVKNAIDAYLSLSGGSSPDAFEDPPETQLIVTALLAVLKDLGLHSGSYRALVTSRIFRGNRAKVETIEKWAEPVRDKFARGALYEVSFRCLYKYLAGGLPTRWDDGEKFLARNCGPVGVREMLIFLDYVPAVMEANFPGYARSGLLHVIPKNLKKATYRRTK